MSTLQNLQVNHWLQHVWLDSHSHNTLGRDIISNDVGVMTGRAHCLSSSVGPYSTSRFAGVCFELLIFTTRGRPHCFSKESSERTLDYL